MTTLINFLQPVFVLEDDFNTGGEDFINSAETFVGQLIQRASIPIHLSETSDTANMSILAELFRYTSLDDGIPAFLKTLYPFEPGMAIARRGLVAMEATEHLEIFDKAQAIATDMGSDNYALFRRAQYELNAETDALVEELQLQLTALEKKYSLIDLNAAWLAQHPDLKILKESEWEAKQDELIARVVEYRKSEDDSTENLSRAERIAVALSKTSRMEFDTLTTLEPRLEVAGDSVPGHNFVTNKGAYFFYEHNGDAIMHEQVTMNPVCKLTPGDMFPE